jgi:regulation of enolase protein 1 (concanavalin A-like superfamily)
MMNPFAHFIRKARLPVLAGLFAGQVLTAAAYTHPCIPLTSADLSTLKANLNLEPWKSGYAALAADGHSSLSYTMQGPFATVGRNPDVNLSQWRNDMIAVYNLARMWYFTGNAAYAQKSRDILIAWANTQTSFTGNESGLDLGDYAFRYAGGASILRGTWSGWTSTDTTKVQSYFNNVFWPASGASSTDTIGPANKGSLYLTAGIAIAAFGDDTTKFNECIRKFRTSYAAGLPNTLATGEMGETGRDQGHAYNDLLCRGFIAEMAWKQGVDLFAEMDNRLLACGEYYAYNNLVSGVQFVPFGTIDYDYFTAPGDAGGSYAADRMGLYIIQGAYNIRKGMSTPWIDRKIERQPVNMDNWMMCKSEDPSTASSPSAISFPSTASVGSGLTSTVVGTATPAGSASFSGGTWTVKGAGQEVWTHSSDSCQFVYKQVTGDCAIVAKVTGVQNTHVNAKAGVMIREALAATTARRAWVGITSGNNLETYMHGWTECWGGSNFESRGQACPGKPYWVKIERRGNTISLLTSQDGTSWAGNTVGVFANMSSTAYIGMFVCSLTNGTLNTSTFEVVSVTGGSGGVVKTPAAPAAVMASPANAKVTLRWLPSADATAYDILRSTVNGSGYAAIASNLSATKTSYTDTSVANGTTYYYVVRGKNSVGTSGNSRQEQATPFLALVNLAFGGTTAASANSGSGTEGSDKAFDRNPGSKWFNGNAGTSGTLLYDFGAGNAQIIKTYTITSAGDVPGRDPKNWTFRGSQDNANWTNIDPRSNQSFAFRNQVNTYTTANNTAYRYYRLDITANNGDPTGLQLAELGLYSDYGRTLPNGTYRILNRKSNKALEVKNGATANGSITDQWPYTGGSNQKWTLAYQSNGDYQLTGVGSGKALEVAGSSTADGAAVDIYTWSGANNQKWTITPTGDGYFRLKPEHSGKAADVNGGSTADGASVIQWSWNGGDNQQWSVTLAP